MNIRDRHAIFRAAEDTLSREGKPLQQLLILYLAIISGFSLLASALTVLLSDRIAGTGGLANMGLRSILSTAQAVLPLVQTVLLTGLQLGYTHAALNARRGKYFSRNTLFDGFRRFVPMLCAYALQSFIYLSLAIICLYLATYIFLVLPVSADFQALMLPLINSASTLSDTIVLDEATVMAVTDALMPVFPIFAAVYLPVFLPTYYRYRMTMFRLIDHPRARPMLAIRESHVMMHRNRFSLLKIDLQLWWYYILQVLAALVCYCDLFLELLGITLPWSATVSYFLFLVLSLALQFILFYFAMNRVTLVYTAAYEALLAEFEEKKAKLRSRVNVPVKSRSNPWNDQY